MNKKTIKQLCHHLNPIVIIGSKGMTESVMQAIDIALNDYELIKIKINHNDKIQRLEWIDTICKKLSTQSVHKIGKTACFLRRSRATPKHSALQLKIS